MCVFIYMYVCVCIYIYMYKMYIYYMPGTYMFEEHLKTSSSYDSTGPSLFTK